MTEIPEHLLKRAQAARDKAASEAPAEAAPAAEAAANSRIPAHLLERSKAREKKNGRMRDDGLQDDERQLSVELAEEKERKKAKDVFLAEAVNILGDDIALQKSGATVTASGSAEASMASARPAMATGKASDASALR